MSLRLMSAVIASSVSQSHSTKIDNSEKLLKQLLECVQECQKRYGGKTELATEFDSCVAALCLSLEAVFLHGLRNKPCTNADNSTLKQVSDIVTQSLHIGIENLSFWPFVKKQLTRHEQERYAVLKHIWTNTGCGRAWIRSALNERSLERYFHTVLSNQTILNEYYEPWAIIRDDEKNSMLPNMAAGLGSILFAVNIDKPELNSGVTYRPDVLKNRSEPIIEAPVSAETKDKKEKRRKKVARQFISFDDDDSMHSSGLPSSSSSTASDSNSIGDNSSLQTKFKQSSNQLNKDNKSNKMNEEPNQKAINEENEQRKASRKVSIENSGSRDKFSSSVPETLTPIAEIGVGELTPISVEVNKNFDSPDISDDILEVPTDISAVLTIVELKNEEELRKKDEKIGLLSKENESLKEQVKKYVSAIQMLRRDDEGLQKALEGLQIEQPPDYKSEAKMFETKLVQVAEMHAELMDFNVILQQSLCQKDALLERLKSELESLRGPMPSDSLTSEEGGSVNVWIPSAFLTGAGSNSHHVYQIYLRAGNDEWNIYRRYAQFYVLHTDLKKLDPVVGTFDFPPKKSIGKKDSALVEDRRKRLQIYLRRILAHWPELSHCNSRFLLEQHLGFFKDQREDLKNKKNMFSARRSGDNISNNYSGL